MSPKTILLLGGSYGGISTAHYILKHVVPSLPDKQSYQVVLVSSSSHFLCRPTCPRALVSESAFPREKLFVPLSRALEQYSKDSFTLLHATAVNLDHANRVISIVSSDNEHSTISYYALVIATGAQAISPLLGLSGDHSRTGEAWALFQEKLPSAKSIIIAGGGPTGVETAGELGVHLNGRRAKLDRPNVSITLVTVSGQLLATMPPSIAQKAEAQLAEVGVSVIKDRRIESVTPSSAGLADDHGGLEHVTDSVTVTLDDGRTLQADLYIPATGVSPNTNFINDQLLDDEGYVMVDSSSLRVQDGGPRVYAIGHVSSFKPRSIHLIMSAVPVLCDNLKRDLLRAASGSEDKK
jgi:NADH dehydrogenase FAD-containing subunit